MSLRQLAILLRWLSVRSASAGTARDYSRNLNYNYGRLVANVMLALVMGVVFYNVSKRLSWLPIDLCCSHAFFATFSNPSRFLSNCCRRC
jgi:hypothetical protein